MKTDVNYGDLMDYYTGAYMRPATKEQRDASREAAKHDGGAGVILVSGDWRVVDQTDAEATDAVRCYVSE